MARARKATRAVVTMLAQPSTCTVTISKLGSGSVSYSVSAGAGNLKSARERAQKEWTALRLFVEKEGQS